MTYIDSLRPFLHMVNIFSRHLNFLNDVVQCRSIDVTKQKS
jgi:hypothetical protein